MGHRVRAGRGNVKSLREQRHGVTALWISAAAVGVFLLDQTTKTIALKVLSPGTPQPVVNDVLRLTLTFDRGHTFEAAAGLPSSWWWGIPAMVMALVLVILLVAFGEGSWLGRTGQIATGLVLGGGVSNLVDHIVGGRIVDFLDVDWVVHWWIFNLADAAMVVGWPLLFASVLSSARQRRR